MADVTIKYKGATIAEMSGTSEKTLETSGTYCEGDIDVVYAPRSKTYEITLGHVGNWVLLTTLDAEVLEHINDPNLVVSFMRLGEYEYVGYTCCMAIATNNIMGYYTGKYEMYGLGQKEITETSHTPSGIFYPANNTATNVPLGGTAFRVSGSNYYIKPQDGGVRPGTYRLTFTW